MILMKCAEKGRSSKGYMGHSMVIAAITAIGISYPEIAGISTIALATACLGMPLAIVSGQTVPYTT